MSIHYCLLGYDEEHCLRERCRHWSAKRKVCIYNSWKRREALMKGGRKVRSIFRPIHHSFTGIGSRP